MRIWCVDATDASGTSASVAARADVSTPDGRVTVSAYAAGDPGLAVTVRDGVERALVSGTLDLRRTRTQRQHGSRRTDSAAGSPSSAAGPASTGC